MQPSLPFYEPLSLNFFIGKRRSRNMALTYSKILFDSALMCSFPQTYTHTHTHTHTHTYIYINTIWPTVRTAFPFRGLKDCHVLISSRDGASRLVRSFSSATKCSRQFSPRREKVFGSWINNWEQSHHKANRGSSAVAQHWESSMLKS